MVNLAAIGGIASGQAAFNVAITAFTAFISEEIHEVRDTVALAAWKGVVGLTPVDTGRAAFSWNFNYGSINPKVPPEGNYGKPSTPAVQGLSVPLAAVFVTSSLDYIIPLEEGHSSKSERMVEKTLFDLTLRMNSLMGGN